ncbi:cytochrome c oxidase assembly protein [Microvirga massiliensis]|uniref:cytochrome c oxidase assembly protein n=1 Tax=Microvirga massiliensis TaxID=1033741 RepID=UPI000B0C8321|nr:cytochrome c oxidase assembly protein [Microvirga massiliensis]
MKGVLTALLLLAPGFALAHGGDEAHAPAWTLAPWITVPLIVSGGLYVRGVTKLWSHAGWGRGVQLWQVLSFAAGWGLLVLALVSPLHWLGERLFTAHMIEHETLMALAAPLLVMARPVGAMLWALPPRTRRTVGSIGRAPMLRTVWRRLVDPPVAAIVHGVALWLWHLPVLYEAALHNTFLHWLQHLSFLGTALLFWFALLQGRARQRGYGAAVLYLFITALHSSFLGILLAFARAPVFPSQTSSAPDWGLTPLEDQQLAGVIMWVPAGLVYAGAALVLAGLWICHSGSLATQGGARAIASR